MKGKLILENGMSFEGKIFGELGETVGELVFNTGMTGYQELITNPFKCILEDSMSSRFIP